MQGIRFCYGRLVPRERGGAYRFVILAHLCMPSLPHAPERAAGLFYFTMALV